MSDDAAKPAKTNRAACDATWSIHTCALQPRHEGRRHECMHGCGNPIPGEVVILATGERTISA